MVTMQRISRSSICDPGDTQTLRGLRGRLRVALTAACVALGLVIAGATPASAWTDAQLSWTGCSWFNLPGAVRVQIDPNYAYPPANQSPEGHVQSFQARIQGAVNSWNGIFANAPKYKHNVKLVTGVATPEIVLRNVTPDVGDPGEYLGYTFVQRQVDSASSSNFAGRCPYKGVVNVPLKYARIETEVRNDYFTQGQEWRGYWENKYGDCPNRTAGAPYSTCSKVFDFEAVMLHELGHALGQPHPSEESVFGGETRPTKSDAAQCWNTLNNATMCRNQNRFSSSGRVLEGWDIDSFNRHTTYIQY